MNHRSSSSGKQDTANEEICALCLDAKKDPVQLHNCKHSFCRSCLKLFREARNWSAKRCPLCRSRLGQQLDAASCKDDWGLTLLLLLALFVLSFGSFVLLMIYW